MIKLKLNVQIVIKILQQKLEINIYQENIKKVFITIVILKKILINIYIL